MKCREIIILLWYKYLIPECNEYLLVRSRDTNDYARERLKKKMKYHFEIAVTK